MNVPVLIRLPVKRLDGLSDRAEQIKKMLRKRGVVVSTEAWRKVTVPNLLRVALKVGLDRMDKMSDDQLMAALWDEGVVRGRPRGR